MKRKVLAIAMTALMVASLTACEGNAKETMAADTATAVTAEEKVEDTMAAENRDEISAGAAEVEAAKEAAGDGLIMTTNVEFPPYEHHNGDTIVGIDTEIAKAVADELGMELEIEDIAFDSIIPEIVSGKANMGPAGMTVTEDHMQSVDFSNTYAKASQKIIITEDSGIASSDDLKGVIVGIQLGVTGDVYVSDLETGGTTVGCYNKGFEAVQALSQDRIDVVITDGEPAKTFITETQGLKILNEPLTDEGYATAVKEGDVGLLEKINGVLRTLRDSGILDEIVAKHIKAE